MRKLMLLGEISQLQINTLKKNQCFTTHAKTTFFITEHLFKVYFIQNTTSLLKGEMSGQSTLTVPLINFNNSTPLIFT